MGQCILCKPVMFVQGNEARIAVIGCNVPRSFPIDMPPGHPEDVMYWKWRGGETKNGGGGG